jgi:serine/threonine protein kinase
MASELSPVPSDLAFDATIRALNTRQQVFGRYVLRRILGRGGMGVVWLAQDERLERDVALKFLPEEVYFDPGALDEMKRETRRCLELTHPNIIRIYDFAQDEQAAAISMEYIDGHTLAALRIEKEQRVFEVAEIKAWIIKACQALHYAHEEVGVVHRDLKPANLMLTSRGQIKVADFGIAQSMGESMSRMTMRRGTSGTLAYMSPQQLGGETPRVTDDIYAMGTTIYEMLTSKPPFYCGDIPFQVRLTLPRTMAERRSELEISGDPIPSEWEESVAACLAKVPTERPKSMLELAERLSVSNATLRTRGRSSAAARVAVISSSVSKPPRLPGRKLPVKQILQVIGLGAISTLLLATLVFLVHARYFTKPGELSLTSNPPGAKVQGPGLPNRTTPATFLNLRSGTYQVVISAPGYEPLEQAITVAPGAKMDLGTLQLQRSLGSLDLATVPLHAHYILSDNKGTGSFHKEGSTPDFLMNLPTGTYQITLTAPKFPSYKGDVQISAHDTYKEAADLTQLGIENTASPDSAKVLRGEMDATKLDTTARTELVDLYNKAFEEYFASGLLAPASDELAKLKALGQNPAPQEARLAQKQAAAENDFSGKINALISAGKFATAQKKFDDLKGTLENESVTRLKQEFQVSFDQYQQQIDTAIKAAKAEPSATGYAQLKALVRQYSDDLNLELALADVQTQMPPDHEFLITQLADFQEFSENNKDFAGEPALVEKQASFADELKQLDALTAALSAAKSGPAKIQDKIDGLESRKKVLKDRRIGHPDANPFTKTINFFGQAMTGHTVIDKKAYFSSAHEKREAIADVQAEIDAAKLLLTQPQGSVADAQRVYDAFVARVPWGQKGGSVIMPAESPADPATAPMAPAQDNPIKL